MLGVLTADEICHLVPYIMSLDPNSMAPLYLGRIFNVGFYHCNIMEVLPVSGVGQELAFSLHEEVSVQVPTIR